MLGAALQVRLCEKCFCVHTGTEHKSVSVYTLALNIKHVKCTFFVTTEALPCQNCHHIVEQKLSLQIPQARRAGQSVHVDGHCRQEEQERRTSLHFVPMRNTLNTRCMFLGTSTAVSSQSAVTAQYKHWRLEMLDMISKELQWRQLWWRWWW
jgi:hypothetical protein